MNDERCDICPLLICDPLNRLCIQTPEAKLEVMRAAKASKRERAAAIHRKYLAKVTKETKRRNIKAVNKKRKFIAALGFKSMAGTRDPDDPRNNLVFEYARLIVELNPKAFIMENVPGIVTMTTPDGKPIVDVFMRILADGSYAPYESLRKMLGLKPGSKSVLRQECKRTDMKADKPKKKPLASAAKVSVQPTMF
jgi:hypothetical protein